MYSQKLMYYHSPPCHISLIIVLIIWIWRKFHFALLQIVSRVSLQTLHMDMDDMYALMAYEELYCHLSSKDLNTIIFFILLDLKT